MRTGRKRSKKINDRAVGPPHSTTLGAKHTPLLVLGAAAGRDAKRVPEESRLVFAKSIAKDGEGWADMHHFSILYSVQRPFRLAREEPRWLVVFSGVLCAECHA